MAEYILTPDERALIEERRKQRAQAELAAREAAALPNVLELSAEEYYKLPIEKRNAMMRRAVEVAYEQ